MSLPLRDTDLHTYDDYLHWSEDQRYELIDGVAYAMAPAPTRQQQRLTFELARAIADALEDDECEVNVAPFDVRFPGGQVQDEVIANVVQPDISVVCDSSKLDDKGCRRHFRVRATTGSDKNLRVSRAYPILGQRFTSRRLTISRAVWRWQ